MPEARPPRLRRTKAPLNPKPPPNPNVPEAVSRLVAELGITLEDLLAWKVYASGKVVVIAPNGMKIIQEVADNNPDPVKAIIRETSSLLAGGVADE
ncbi:MAG: hypothetical protein Q7U53_01350 [Anaerolineaceae bacterium]|nr:hypothetical protein [Anaerolineaceae bacterium]